MFRSESFLPLAPASAVHSGSKSNSSVYRLNRWLHSSSVWAFDKKGFGEIHLSCLVKFVCSVLTWPWNATRKLLGSPRALVLRSKCCICSREGNILLYTKVYVYGSVDFLCVYGLWRQIEFYLWFSQHWNLHLHIQQRCVFAETMFWLLWILHLTNNDFHWNYFLLKKFKFLFTQYDLEILLQPIHYTKN